VGGASSPIQEAAAFSSLALTVGLAIARPRIRRFQVTPAVAAVVGVVLMLLVGAVRPADVGEAASDLWRPLTTVAAIMVLTAAARRLGVLDRLAPLTVARAHGSAERHFALVFVMSALTAAVLNNDAAILLLTPLVVLHVRDVYDDPRMQVPFAFAVYMAAGVAPFVVSNPMNFIVAELVGIGFNEYAARMLPIAIAGWIVSFVMLRLLVGRQLREGQASMRPMRNTERSWKRPQIEALAVLAAVLIAYPIASFFDKPIWGVAVGGALLALWVCRRHGAGKPIEILRTNVSWDTLGFLLGVLVLAFGLRNVGFVEQLSDFYEEASIWTIGFVSAIGSAIVNNHPMALINLLAIGGTVSPTKKDYLAALIGGDLGPRLAPIGSLAGLLWYASLRALNVHVPVTQFMRVGLIVTVPSVAVSLLILAAF
jgi:arsenical pump membrane protein